MFDKGQFAVEVNSNKFVLWIEGNSLFMNEYAHFAHGLLSVVVKRLDSLLDEFSVNLHSSLHLTTTSTVLCTFSLADLIVRAVAKIATSSANMVFMVESQ